LSGRRLEFATVALKDIEDILDRSSDQFGRDARDRYEALLLAALGDLSEDPERPTAQIRADLPGNLRTYHVKHARHRASQPAVANPRHLILYRIASPTVVAVARVLHEAMDIERHVDEP
jgi:toxin ParE1/3/4